MRDDWNQEIPFRPLDHVFRASSKVCDAISRSDLETVLARGKVPIVGTRDDIAGLADRIEKLLSKAERIYFYPYSNSISAKYNPMPAADRAALFGAKSILARPSPIEMLRRDVRSSLTTNMLRPELMPFGISDGIEFKNVRVHWPKMIEALQEAGFDIGLQREREGREMPTARAAEYKQKKFIRFMKTERKKHGRYPPRDRPELTQWPGMTLSEWARKNGVRRQQAGQWAKDHGLTERRGALKRNSAKK
jgi:hypothetical protein